MPFYFTEGKKMSMKIYWYIGPYIKAYFHYEDKDKEMLGCSKCMREFIEPFCQNCGNKKEKFIVKSKEKSVSYMNLEEFEDIFVDTGEIYHENFEILRSNEREPNFELDEIMKLKKITKKDIDKELNWFKKRYIREIIQLSLYYDNIEIEWGIVQSCR